MTGLQRELQVIVLPGTHAVGQFPPVVTGDFSASRHRFSLVDRRIVRLPQQDCVTAGSLDARDMNSKPETLDEVKVLVAGDLGEQLERYPLRCAIPVFFGPALKPGTTMTVSNGSASLVALSGAPHVLTCWHVLDGYRQALQEGRLFVFQVGDCKLDPLAQLVDEDEAFDIVVIRLSEAQASEVTQGSGNFGTFFVEPPAWPPAAVVEGSFIAFGGFPGELRRALSFKELSFGAFASGGSRVTSARDTYLVCQFDRENWVMQKFEPEPANIRGMSGGPAFALRRSPEAGIISYEFVGVIYEFSEDYELLYIRLAKVLTFDGRIVR